MLLAARRALSSVLAAEMQMLIAAQRAERQRALGALDEALRSKHAVQTSAVVARFGHQRSVLSLTDPAARAAELHRLASEETAELARLALEHGTEKRRIRALILGDLTPVHRAARQSLRQSQRHQRLGFAILTHPRGFDRSRTNGQQPMARSRRPISAVIRGGT